MNEIEDRLETICRTADGNVARPMFESEYLAAEFCIHQLRIVCELIALACLVAHDGIPEARSKILSKEYSASKIFYVLGKFSPRFFPSPVTLRYDEAAGMDRMDPNTDDCMTREGLEDLYEYCNNLMHRARLKDLLAGKRHDYDFEGLHAKAWQIVRLLGTHLITIAFPQRLIRVRMGGPNGAQWQPLEVAPLHPQPDKPAPPN